MAISIKTMPNPWSALGVAAHFVARHEPFSQFGASDLVRTLYAQTSSGKYLLAFDAQGEPARVAGYFGWAHYSHAQAERFAATGEPPSRETQGGGVLWVLTAVADSEAAFRALVRATRALHPDHRVMAVRHRNGRRIILDQWRERALRREKG